jgi:hypothetical protein
MWRRVFAMWGRCEKSVGAWLRVSGAGGLSFLCFCLFAGAASAQSDSPGSEVFTGFEASDNYASGYVGAGYALGKAGLYEPGFRLRAVGAYGRYHYDGTLLDNGVHVPTTFDSEVAFLSALVGYQFRPGRLIVKLFAGIEAEDQHIVPHDPNNSVQGSELGLRLQEESWLDISPRLFSRLTLAMAQPSRNIARSLASAFASGRDFHSGSKAGRSAMRNMMQAAAVASCV